MRSAERRAMRRHVARTPSHAPLGRSGVSPEGPGIAAEHLPRVFDRFYKVDESRVAQGSSGGSGLGLSIVKAIVERHGATITVASVPGRTVFEIQGFRKR